MLEIVIGIIFVLLLFSLLATTIMESIAGIFALRGENLMKALKHILAHDGDETLLNTFKESDLYKQLCSKRGINKNYRPPSYINEESFWSILSNTLFKDTDGSALSLQYRINELESEGKISTYIKNIFLQFLYEIEQEDKANNKIENIKLSIGEIENDDLRNQLLSFAESGERKILSFKSKVQGWYNSIMDRTSGWYKRQTQLILFIIGVLIAIGFNADVIAIYQQLSADPDLAMQIAEQAAVYLEENPDPEIKREISELVREDIASVQSPLGIGWQLIDKEDLISPSFWMLKIVGWLVTALSVTLGAPFWFDLLRKLVNIRNAGKAPEAKTS